MIIRKKYRTIAAAVKEIEALEEQVIANANTVNALRREIKNSPIQIELDDLKIKFNVLKLGVDNANQELDKLKSKWYVKLFYRGK